MSPTETLLAYLDADPTHALAGFVATIPGLGARGLTPDEFRNLLATTPTGAFGMPVGDALALLRANPAIVGITDPAQALGVQALAVRIDYRINGAGYKSIYRDDADFVAMLAGLGAIPGLLPADIDARIEAAFGKVSLATQAGFATEPTEADVAAARAEKAAAELAAAKLAKNLEIDADRDRQFAPIIAQREARIAAVMAAGTVEAVAAIVVGE